MIPLLSEHDTWLSIDPIVGCPAHCEYCFVQKANKTASRPIAYVTPQEVLERVATYFTSDFTFTGVTPTRFVCLGNYTDMFMTEANCQYAIAYSQLHHDRFPNVPLVFISKAALKPDLVKALDDIAHPILFFISQSFFYWSKKGYYEKGVASPEQSARNLQLLSGTRHLKPLHFWRPVTILNVPSEEAAIKQLLLLRESGSLASVATGLKFGDYLSEKFKSPYSPFNTLQEEADFSTDGEIFPDPLRKLITRVAQSVNYPLYLNTSCAVSYVLQKPDFWGTNRYPLRASRCEPANCCISQRARCDNKKPVQPTNAFLEKLAQHLIIPNRLVKWDKPRETILIDSYMSQSTQCRLSHATEIRVRSFALEKQREWLGVVTREKGMMQFDVQIELPRSLVSPELHQMIERMKGITGMLTPEGPEAAPRPRLFNRYRHVFRVATVALNCAAQIENTGREINTDRVRWLAWLHDLNRFPFAHNAENGQKKYDQAADLERYFEHGCVYVPPQDIQDLRKICTKDDTSLSIEGKIVLAADRATGVIEDTLFAITALGLSPKRIGTSIAEHLGLPLHQAAFCEKLWELRQKFLNDGQVDEYAEQFDCTVIGYAIELVYRWCLDWTKFFLDEHFKQHITKIKTEFLLQTLFPITNEKISHAHQLNQVIIQPLIKYSGEDYLPLFTTLSDRDAIDIAKKNGFIESEAIPKIAYAELDYIPIHQPQDMFRETDFAC